MATMNFCAQYDTKVNHGKTYLISVTLHLRTTLLLNPLFKSWLQVCLNLHTYTWSSHKGKSIHSIKACGCKYKLDQNNNDSIYLRRPLCKQYNTMMTLFVKAGKLVTWPSHDSTSALASLTFTILLYYYCLIVPHHIAISSGGGNVFICRVAGNLQKAKILEISTPLYCAKCP